MDAGENLCVTLELSSSKGSREVVMSLTTDDRSLLLMMEALSKALRGAGIAVIVDIPEIEDAADRKPLKCTSLAGELDTGRLSGKRAFTMVTKSDGPRT